MFKVPVHVRPPRPPAAAPHAHARPRQVPPALARSPLCPGTRGSPPEALRPRRRLAIYRAAPLIPIAPAAAAAAGLPEGRSGSAAHQLIALALRMTPPERARLLRSAGFLITAPRPSWPRAFCTLGRAVRAQLDAAAASPVAAGLAATYPGPMHASRAASILLRLAIAYASQCTFHFARLLTRSLPALLIAALAASGCTHAHVTMRDDPGPPPVRVTHASGFALFDSSSSLQQLAVASTTNGHSLGVGSLTQSASSSNLVNGLRLLIDLLATELAARPTGTVPLVRAP